MFLSFATLFPNCRVYMKGYMIERDPGPGVARIDPTPDPPAAGALIGIGKTEII
jgi:hypothetical protein